MDFSIAFTGDSAEDDDLVAVGEITLGEHREGFHSAIDYWSSRQYEDSWRIALQRLVDGKQVSCLITNMVDPERANFLTVWPLYGIGGQVHVQNQILFLRELDAPFDPAEPWRSVDARETVDEDGNRISEWVVSLDDVRQFLEDKAAPGAA